MSSLESDNPRLEKLVDPLLSSETILDLLDPLDPSTREHSMGVAIYAGTIACIAGYSHRDARIAFIGALIHDIGKPIIGNDILEKPGVLSTFEWQIVKMHTQAGYLRFRAAAASLVKEGLLTEEESLEVARCPLGHHLAKSTPYPTISELRAAGQDSPEIIRDLHLASADSRVLHVCYADISQVFSKGSFSKRNKGGRKYIDARAEEDGTIDSVQKTKSSDPGLKLEGIMEMVEQEVSPELFEVDIVKGMLQKITYIDRHPLIKKARDKGLFTKELGLKTDPVRGLINLLGQISDLLD